jgi:hypothetical protein
VLARGGARRVEGCLLHKEDIGALGMVSPPDGAFGRGDLIQRAAQVDGAGPQAFGRPPRRRPVERVVHFENAGTVAVAAELAPVGRGQTIAGDALQLARRDIEEGGGCRRQIVHPADPLPGDDLAAQAAQVRGQTVGDPLRAAAGHGPTDRVRQHAQNETERGGRRPFERHDRMRSHACEYGAGALAAEQQSRQTGCGQQGRRTKAQQAERMPRKAQRAEHFREHVAPVRGQRPHQPSVSRGVGAELRGGGLDRAFDQDGRTVIQRMRNGRGWENPRQAMFCQR